MRFFSIKILPIWLKRCGTRGNTLIREIFTGFSSEFGKNPHLVHFLGKACTVRRTDGTLVTTPVSPYPLLLFEYREKNDWESCVRLCRFVQDRELWACLASMAIDGNELNTAEVAFAAIEEVDKLQFIAHIKEIPSIEGRNAELYLFKVRFNTPQFNLSLGNAKRSWRRTLASWARL